MNRSHMGNVGFFFVHGLLINFFFGFVFITQDNICMFNKKIEKCKSHNNKIDVIPLWWWKWMERHTEFDNNN